MKERTLSPRLSPVAPGSRPTIRTETYEEIDAIVEDMTTEIVEVVKAELKARLEHISLHLNPKTDNQEILVRTLPYQPFFEVTSREI